MGNATDKKRAFSLIEVVVVLGIIAALVPAAYTIGLPEYDRYISRLKKEAFGDGLLDDRARAIATGKNVAVHDDGGNFIGTFSAQGKLTASTTNEYKVNIDENGFIDGL